MELFKRLSLICLATVCLGAMGQTRDARQLIAENPDRAACNMHSYEFLPIVDTPAPAGFQPVYISHYGRHGSRYDLSSSVCDRAIRTLAKADSLGQLTSTGRELLGTIKIIAKEHEGMGGELSPRGGREHQQLAERMAGRFPEVFSQEGRSDVNVVASTVQRCIVSMANFTSSLKGAFPTIHLQMTSGERFSPIIRLSNNKTHLSLPEKRGDGISRGAQGRQDKGKRDAAPLDGNFDQFMSKVFVRPETVTKEDRDDFIRSVYKAGGFCQDLDFLGVEVYRTYFTIDELYSLWKEENNTVYGRWANSIENGEKNTQQAIPLLRDIITKADQALESGSTVVADLRFGHDMGYMALAALLGIDTDDGERYHQAEAYRHWMSFEMVPMAANLQFIFYRNQEGVALVKILRNEKEVSLPGLIPYAGPYYKWDDVKGIIENHD